MIVEDMLEWSTFYHARHVLTMCALCVCVCVCVYREEDTPTSDDTSSFCVHNLVYFDSGFDSIVFSIIYAIPYNAGSYM